MAQENRLVYTILAALAAILIAALGIITTQAQTQIADLRARITVLESDRQRVAVLETMAAQNVADHGEIKAQLTAVDKNVDEIKRLVK